MRVLCLCPTKYGALRNSPERGRGEKGKVCNPNVGHGVNYNRLPVGASYTLPYKVIFHVRVHGRGCWSSGYCISCVTLWWLGRSTDRSRHPLDPRARRCG